jgi:hypothetical protein
VFDDAEVLERGQLPVDGRVGHVWALSLDPFDDVFRTQVGSTGLEEHLDGDPPGIGGATAVVA